ncbi:MAG TPA: DUF3631 domain-containing protein [Micromonosporaceae bacterium]|nr:DUF3631 domain-containing protein [Micromonosporaceae bacterium]
MRQGVDSVSTPGAAVLDEVAAFVARYVAFPTQHALTAVTLWAAHTHAVGCFYVTPRLVLDSAEPGSGKTRVLELLNLLCRHPEMTISISTAALFRLVSAHPHTILFDEVDAIFNPRNSGNHEDLRALLNAGYKRGATIARCVGDAKSIAVQRFSVFSPVALAGLAGNMPATILTRAVTIHMRRRASGEPVEPFEEQEAEQLAEPIRERLATWAAEVANTLATARPVMPNGVVDRAAEVWRALLAIADAAGQRWPDAGREACRHFVLTAAETPTFGTRLLADLHAVFAGRDRMPTVEILDALVAIETAPWADLGGKPLDARRLAKELGRYDVGPTPIRDADGRPTKGYTTYPTTGNVGLGDVWDRYLSGLRGYIGYSGYAAGHSADDGNRTAGASVTAVTPQGHVTDVAVTPQDPVTGLTRHVTAVTDVTAHPGPTGTPTAHNGRRPSLSVSVPGVAA